MEKSKEEWARQHLAQMGNQDPKPESIQYYVDLVTPGTMVYNEAEQDLNRWAALQYKRWVDRDEEEALIQHEVEVEHREGKTLAELYNVDE